MGNIFIPLFLFALIMTVTPGPNNMLLTASGAKFGYRKTVPLITGIVLGIVSQLCLGALGLGILFEKYPILHKILKTAGTIYIIYLAFRIAFSKRISKENTEVEKPFNLFQGALFQYMNPKAYVMTITAMSVYSIQGEYYILSILMVIMVFTLLTPLSISLWAAFGTVIGKFTKERHAGKINMLLGIATAGSAVFILMP